MFLSRRAVKSFAGYADAQLRRLENALARDNYSQSEKEVHILNSVRNAMSDFNAAYADFQGGSLKIYIDQAVSPLLDTEIFIDADLKHYPLRDYESMWNVMHNVVKAYGKVGKRNKKKDDLHLNKHAMHLIRLFMMGIDILEKEEINTYREKEHDLLMDIRMGKYQGTDGNFNEAFYDMLNEYEKRMKYAAENTSLPELPDQKKINEYVMQVNESVILGNF